MEMMFRTLRVREALPWLGIGAALIAVFVFLPIVFSPGEDEDTRWLGLLLWLVFVPGVIAAVRGLLLLTADLDARQAMRLGALALAGIVASIVLHNVISGLLGVEEGLFFVLALFAFPLVLVAAAIRAVRPGGENGDSAAAGRRRRTPARGR